MSGARGWALRAFRGNNPNPYNEQKWQIAAHMASLMGGTWTQTDLRLMLEIDYPELKWSPAEMSQIKHKLMFNDLIALAPGEPHAFKPGKRYRWKGGEYKKPTLIQRVKPAYD